MQEGEANSLSSEVDDELHLHKLADEGKLETHEYIEYPRFDLSSVPPDSVAISETVFIPIRQWLEQLRRYDMSDSMHAGRARASSPDPMLLS